MAGMKRKASSLSDSPGQSPGSSTHQNGHSPSRLPPSSKRSRVVLSPAMEAAAKVTVEYQLVGTDKVFTRPMRDRKLEAFIPDVAAHFGIPQLGMRLVHVRHGGVESEFWDDFDFQCIKARAVATGSKKEIVRVYSEYMRNRPQSIEPRDTGSGPASASSPAHELPPSQPPAGPSSSAAPTPRSAIRVPSTDGTPRLQKRVLISAPGDSPPLTPSPSPRVESQASLQTPNPSPGELNSRNTKKRKVKKRASMDSSHTFAVSNEPTGGSSAAPSEDNGAGDAHAEGPSSTLDATQQPTPAPSSVTMARYRPSRPSPLSQTSNPGQLEDESETGPSRSGAEPSPGQGAPSKTSGAAAKKAKKVASPKKKAATPPAKPLAPTQKDSGPKPKRGRPRPSDLPPTVGTLPVSSLNQNDSASQQVPEDVSSRAAAPTPISQSDSASLRPRQSDQIVEAPASAPSAANSSRPAKATSDSATIAQPGKIRKRRKSTQVAAAAADVTPGPTEIENVPISETPSSGVTESNIGQSMSGGSSEHASSPPLPEPTTASSTAATVVDTTVETSTPENDTTTVAPPTTTKEGKKKAKGRKENLAQSIMRAYREKLAAEAAAAAASSSQGAQPSNEGISESSNMPSSTIPISSKQSNTVEATATGESALSNVTMDAGPNAEEPVSQPQTTVLSPAEETGRASDVANATRLQGVEELMPTPMATPANLDAQGSGNDTEPESNFAQGSEPTPEASDSGSDHNNGSVPCPLCNRKANHLQKDCPAVLSGVEGLKKRLTERQSELKRLAEKAKEEAAALRKLRNHRGRVTSTTDIDEAYDEEHDNAIRMIKTWINKLTDTLKTKGNSRLQAAQSALVSQVIGTRNDQSLDVTADESVASEVDSASPSPPSSPQPQGVQGTPNAPFYPTAIHLKAMARPRRPGSMSGLSVSDAVIETGDSSSDDDSNSSSSSIESSSESESSSDDDSDSDDSSSTGVIIDSEALMHQIMNRPLTKRQQRQARVSAATMHPITVGEDISDIEESDEEEHLGSQRPRSSARRGSDSSIGDFEDGTQQGDREEAHSDPESDEANARATLLEKVAEATKVAHTDFNGDDLEVEDVSNVPNGVVPMDVERPDDVETPESSEEPSDSPRPAEIPVTTLNSEGEIRGSSLNSSRGRSFTKIAARAESSPMLDDLPGDIALREAIHEDVPLELGPNEARDEVEALSAVNGADVVMDNDIVDLPATQVIIESESQMESQVLEPLPDVSEATIQQPKRRGRPPKNASSSQPLRRTTRGSSQEPTAPLNLSASQPPLANRRRTRASSKEEGSVGESPSSQPVGNRRTTRASPRESEPVYPKRVTRSASKDLAKVASPQLSTRKSSSSQAPILEEQNSDGSDTEMTPAGIPQSQSSGLAASFPLETQPFNEGDGDRSPLVPPSSLPNGTSHPSSNCRHVEEESQIQPTQSSPLKGRTRGEYESPLFMSQGSQVRETQAYNPTPDALFEETQVPDSEPMNGSSPVGVKRTSNVRNDIQEQTDSDSDDDDGYAPAIPLSRPRNRGTPAPRLSNVIAPLSSLSKDILRSGRSMTNAVYGNAAKGTTPSASQKSSQRTFTFGNSSDSDGDPETDPSSDEEAVGQYAGRVKSKPVEETRIHSW